MERPAQHRLFERRSEPLSRAQEIHLQLIEMASFNSLDGYSVAGDLRRHRSWWIAVLVERFEAGDRLVTLRDLPRGYWNADTLLVLTDSCFRADVELMAQRWSPTEIEWLGNRRASRLLGVPEGLGLHVLRAWWD